MAWPTSIIVSYHCIISMMDGNADRRCEWMVLVHLLEDCHIDVPALQVAAATSRSLSRRVQTFTGSLTTRVLWLLHALLIDLCRIAHLSKSIAPSRTSEVLSNHSHLMFCCLYFHYSAKTTSSLIAHSLRFGI